MKALWNKICRTFGINKHPMTTIDEAQEQEQEQERTRSWFSQSILWRLITGDTERQLVSNDMAEVLSDKELRAEFNKQKMDQAVKKITLEKNGKTYIFIK